MFGVVRAPEGRDGNTMHRVGWDATDLRNAGAERTSWDTLLEMDIFDYREREMDQRAITLVLDLAIALWAGQSFFLFLENAIFPKGDFACAMRSFRTSATRSVRGMRGGAAPDHPGHPSWAQTWSCLPLDTVLQDALRGRDESVSAHEAEGACGRYHSFLGRVGQ